MSKERTRNGQPRQSEGVRAFKRGLDVLQEVNRSGGIRAGDVARALDLPRPTVYRLLETLEELGYVARSASDERFRVTRLALSLGDGYDPGVVSARRPRLFSPNSAKLWSGRSISRLTRTPRWWCRKPPIRAARSRSTAA
ncbi:DNA-binding transcriptional ArsR family regulator [Bradyrhizobium japonicum]|nr:IclR family mhp operon transcriptional activator [Bradyrhizobium japonicum]MCP1860052.1 IclR family mhp operon transcriptional activator [Bradyrhizobium japonicum]MCP1890818.1 IclR family mhp operon transcriptional activator [Bradyrhizobium japonicum]MCW2323851.1 IclR family mhp operon transcriptional activator [Bradyrhizobium japonicum]